MSSDRKTEDINKIMTDWQKEVERTLKPLRSLHRLCLWLDFILSYPPQQESIFEGLPSLPRIEDYSPEFKRKRMIREVQKTVQRRRKLSAEDMVKIYLLRVDKRCSFRSIAKLFKVNESAVRKVFQKIKTIVDNV